MNEKLFFAMIITVLLILMLAIPSKAQVARTDGIILNDIIFILPDGSINGTTNIQTTDNITYFFMANINESIIVERNNITIDGNGYTLLGSGSQGYGRGIDLSFTTNVTIKNSQIENFFTGVYLIYSSNEVISGNNIIANSWEGISLQSSSNNIARALTHDFCRSQGPIPF